MEKKSLYQNKNFVPDFQSTKISLLSKKFYFFAYSVSVKRSSSWINLAYKLQKLIKKLNSGYFQTNTRKIDAEKIALTLKGDEHFFKSKLQFIQFFLKKYSNFSNASLILNHGSICCASHLKLKKSGPSQYNLNFLKRLPYKTKWPFNYFFTGTFLPFLSTEKKQKGIITYLKKKSLNLPIVHFSIFNRTFFQKCQLNKKNQNNSASKIRTEANFKNKKDSSSNVETLSDVFFKDYSKSKEANFKKSFFLSNPPPMFFRNPFFKLKFKKGEKAKGENEEWLFFYFNKNERKRFALWRQQSKNQSFKSILTFNFFKQQLRTKENYKFKKSIRFLNSSMAASKAAFFAFFFQESMPNFAGFSSQQVEDKSLNNPIKKAPLKNEGLLFRRAAFNQLGPKKSFLKMFNLSLHSQSLPKNFFYWPNSLFTLKKKKKKSSLLTDVSILKCKKQTVCSVEKYFPQVHSFSNKGRGPVLNHFQHDFLRKLPVHVLQLKKNKTKSMVSVIKKFAKKTNYQFFFKKLQFSIYMPQKKSFFCYWLLPFIGFLSFVPFLRNDLSVLGSSISTSKQRFAPNGCNHINNAVLFFSSQTNFFQFNFLQLLKKTSLHQNINTIKYVNSTYGCSKNDSNFLGPRSKIFLNSNSLNKKNFNQFNESYTWVGKALLKNQIITSPDFFYYSPILNSEANNFDVATPFNSDTSRQITHIKENITGLKKEIEMKKNISTYENLLNFNLVNRSFFSNLLNNPKGDLNFFSGMFGHGNKGTFNCIYTTFKPYVVYKKYNSSNSKNIKTEFGHKKPYLLTLLTSLNSINFDYVFKIAKKESSSFSFFPYGKKKEQALQSLLKKGFFCTSESKTNFIPNNPQNLIFLTNFPKRIILPTLKNKNLSKSFSATIEKLPPFSYQKAVLLFEDKLKIHLLKNQSVRNLIFFSGAEKNKINFRQRGGALKSLNMIKNKIISYTALKKSLNKITSRNNKVTPYSNEEIVNTSYAYFVKAKQKRKKTFFNPNSFYFNKTFANDNGTSFLVPLLNIRKPLNKPTLIGLKAVFDNTTFHKKKRKPFILGKKTTFIEKAVFNPLLLSETTFSLNNQPISNTTKELKQFFSMAVKKKNASEAKKRLRLFFKLLFQRKKKKQAAIFHLKLAHYPRLSVEANNTKIIVLNLLNELFILKKSIVLNEINEKSSYVALSFKKFNKKFKRQNTNFNTKKNSYLKTKIVQPKLKLSFFQNTAPSFKVQKVSLTKSLYQNLSLLLDQIYTACSFKIKYLNSQSHLKGRRNINSPVSYSFKRNALVSIKNHSKVNVNNNLTWFPQGAKLKKNKKLGNYSAWLKKQIVLNNECSANFSTKGWFFYSQLNFFLPKLANNFKRNYNVLSQNKIIPKIIQCNYPIIKSHSIPTVLITGSKTTHRPTLRIFSNRKLPLTKERQANLHLSNLLYRPFVLKKSYNSLLKISPQMINSVNLSKSPFKKVKRNPIKKKATPFFFSFTGKEKDKKREEFNLKLWLKSFYLNNFLEKIIYAKNNLPLLGFSKKKLIFDVLSSNVTFIPNLTQKTRFNHNVFAPKSKFDSELESEGAGPILNLNSETSFFKLKKTERSGLKKMKGILFVSKNNKHVFNLNTKNQIEKNFINQRNVPAFAITFHQLRFSKLKNFYPLYTNINYRDLEVTKFGIKTRVDKLFRTLLSQSLGKPGNKDPFKKTSILKSKTLSNRLKIKYNLFTTLKTNFNNKQVNLPVQMIPQTKRHTQISLKEVLLQKNKETNLLIKNRFYKITNLNFNKLSNVRHKKKNLNKLSSFDSKKATVGYAFLNLKSQEADSFDKATSYVFVPQKNVKRLIPLQSNNSLKKRNIKKKNVLNFSQHRFPLNFEIKNNQFIYTLHKCKITNSKIEKPIKVTYKYFVNNFSKKNFKNTKLTTDVKNKILVSSFNGDLTLTKDKQTPFLNLKKNEAPLLIKQNQKGAIEKKNLQKKRRALKQRRETGRLLKRKRFYPRPTWLRLTMYRKFLNLRHKLPKVKKLPNMIYMPAKQSLVIKHDIKKTKNTNRKIKWNSGSVCSSYNYNPFKIYSKPYKSIITNIANRTMIGSASSDSFNLKFNNNNKLFFVTPSLLIESQPTAGLKNFKIALNGSEGSKLNKKRRSLFFLGNAPAFYKYLTTPIFDQTELYNVSPICNALTELKPSLSSRLKTNLNSYLRRLKLSFKQLKTTFPLISHRQWGYGPQTSTTDQRLLNFLKSKNYFSLFEFVHPYSYSNDPSQNIIKDKGIATIPTLAQNLFKWETSIKKALLAEISGAKRIEQIITNLKYNLTGKSFSNSNKLNYSSLLIDQELYATQNQNQSQQPTRSMPAKHALNSKTELRSKISKSGALLNARQIWNNASKKIKLGTPIQKDFSLLNSVTSLIQKPAASLSNKGRRNLSNLSIELPFFTLKNEGFSNVSKQKVYWAINKTHMWLYKNGNKKKYLWANQKQREQNRSNKTKKLLSIAETTSKAAIEETYIINSNRNLNFSATQSYNLFLKKQKQKENKINAAGFYDSKLCLPKNHISKMLPHWVRRLKNNHLINFSNSLKGKESNLATFLFSIHGLFSLNHSKFHTTNTANTSYLHQWSHENIQREEAKRASYKHKTGILKDHQVFLRHLKVKLQSNFLLPSNQNMKTPSSGMAGSILQLNNSLYLEKNNNNNKTVLMPQQSLINLFLKQNLNYYYSYVTLYKQQKTVNGLLVGQNSIKHRANNYLEKRLISKKLRLNNYPYKKNSLSNFLSSSKKLLNFLEIKNISHLNFNINFKNSTNTFFYLIFVMCTIQIFHLCSLFSLTSSSEIRSVIKFFILFSLKIIYLYTGLTHTIFLSLRSSKLRGKVSNVAGKFSKLFEWPKKPPKKTKWALFKIEKHFTIKPFPFLNLKKSLSFLKDNEKQAIANKQKTNPSAHSSRIKKIINPFFFPTMQKRKKYLSIFTKDLCFLKLKRKAAPFEQLFKLGLFKNNVKKIVGEKKRGKRKLCKSEGPICTSRKKFNINFNSLFLNTKHYLMFAKYPKSLNGSDLWIGRSKFFFGKALHQIIPQVKSEASNLKKDLNLTTDYLFYKTNFKNKLVKSSNIIKVKIISLQLLNGFLKKSLNASYFLYRLVQKAIEIPKTGFQLICSFFEKPGESFSDWIINYFLIEIASDLTTTIPENLDLTLGNITKKVAKAYSFRIIPIFGTALEKRLFNSFQGELVEILSQPDTDLIVRQKKVSYAWDIWGEILRNIAEKNNINMSLLTNKKEDQAFLISQLLENNKFDTKIKTFFSYFINQIKVFSFKMISIQLRNNNKKKTTNLNTIGTNLFFKTYKNKIHWKLKNKQNYHNFNITFSEASNLFISGISEAEKKNQSQWVKTKKMAFLEKNINLLHKPIIKKNNIWKRWSANQFMTYKDKDSDLFIQAPPAPSLAKVTFQTIKHYNSIQAPIGNIICQIYSGIFSKKTAKNFLVVGALSAKHNSNYDEKSLLIQSLAGETEMKIIKDNANRYNFTLGIKSLRNVFDALALHTPCIFLIEDIHVIGERRPFLVGDDENAEAIQNSSGIEPHQHLDNDEKNLSIAKLTRHVVMHYKKPFWGDYSNLIPTNNYSFDFFLGVSSSRTREYNLTPLSPILLEKDSIPFLTKSPIFPKASILQARQSLKKEEKKEQPTVEKLAFKPEGTEINIKTTKPKNTVNETAWLGLAEQTTVSNEPSTSIRVKIALLAHLAVSNLSVKLNMITDLLVIIDSVRSNRGFVVFATTHTPSILDPALRRPGRLDETISLPFIPKLENRWEIVKSNVISLNSTPSFFSFKNGISNNNFIFKGKSESGFPFGLTVDLLDYSLTNKQASFTSTNQTGNLAIQKLQNSALQIQIALIKFKKIQSKFDQISLKVNQPFQWVLKNCFAQWPRYPAFLIAYSNNKRLRFPAKGSGPLVKKKKAAPFLKFKKEAYLKPTPRINESFFLNNILEPSIFNKLTSNNYFLPFFFSYAGKNKKTHFKNLNHKRIPFIKKSVGNLKKYYTLFKKKATPFFYRCEAKQIESRVEKNKVIMSQTLNLKTQKKNLPNFIKPIFFGNKKIIVSSTADKKIQIKISSHYYKKYKTNKVLLKKTLIAIAYSKIGQLLINNKFAFNYSKQPQGVPRFAQSVTLLTTLHSQFENQNEQKEYDSPFLHLYTKQKNIKQILMNLFTAKVTETFAVNRAKFNQLPTDQNYHQKKTNVPIFRLLSLQSIDKTWRKASSLIFAYIEKQLIYKKSLVIPKLLQFYNAGIQSSTLQDPPSAPLSFLLLPAKRYENYKRSFSAMQNQNASYDKNTIFKSVNLNKSSLEKRLLKKKRYTLVDDNKLNNSASSFKDKSLNTGNLNLNNISKPLLAVSNFLEKPTSNSNNITHINSYYRNRLLNRHRGYINNQWWNAQLSEHNVETTFLSDVDWRSNFVSSFLNNRLTGGSSDKLLPNSRNINNEIVSHRFAPLYGSLPRLKNLTLRSFKKPISEQNTFSNTDTLTATVASSHKAIRSAEGDYKQEHSINKPDPENLIQEQNSFFDSLLDYPDFDQHYNPKNRRWILNFGYWSSFKENLQKNHNKELYSYLVMESFLKTYHYLNSNREILDYLTTKLIKLGLIKENTLIDSIKRF